MNLLVSVIMNNCKWIVLRIVDKRFITIPSIDKEIFLSTSLITLIDHHSPSIFRDWVSPRRIFQSQLAIRDWWSSFLAGFEFAQSAFILFIYISCIIIVSFYLAFYARLSLLRVYIFLKEYLKVLNRFEKYLTNRKLRALDNDDGNLMIH